jgi:hypothetical protein
MVFTVAAVLLGLLLGFGLGGHISNVNRHPLQLTSLLLLSVLAQAAAELLPLGDTLGLSVVLVSYIGLTAFALANIRLVGMPVVLVGLLCNLVVISVNGGMPVRASAVLAARAAAPAELDSLDFGAKRHLERADDRLTVLGDVVPVRPTREVLSFGDLILAVGIGDVLFRLLKPAIGRRRREPGERDIDLRVHDERPVRARPPELVNA